MFVCVGAVVNRLPHRTPSQLASLSTQPESATRHSWIKRTLVAARAHSPDRPKLGLGQLTCRKPPQRNTT